MTSSETVQGVIQSVREQREKFERFCLSLGEEELARPVPDSAWVVKDFVSHLGTLDPERGLARTSAGMSFEDRGEHELKGVGEPMRVWAVVHGEAS